MIQDAIQAESKTTMVRRALAGFALTWQRTCGRLQLRQLRGGCVARQLLLLPPLRRWLEESGFG